MLSHKLFDVVHGPETALLLQVSRRKYLIGTIHKMPIPQEVQRQYHIFLRHHKNLADSHPDDIEDMVMSEK
jgi:hypothetical protein